MQFAAKRIVIAIFAMIEFSVRVGGGAHILEIRFCKRRLIRRQGALGSPTGREEDNGDERCKKR